MSDVGQAFAAAFGAPDPETPPGLTLGESMEQDAWDMIRDEVRAGWFWNRFLYLFGPGLEKLQPCLAAWSFLFPAEPRERIILGYNAHGALLVLERNDAGLSQVFVVDPLQVHYWTDPDLDFIGLIGFWLANKKLTNFLDNRLYETWRQQGNGPLPEGFGLVPKAPLSLGGKLELDNFQVEELVTYYQTTGPLYQKALKKR